MSATDVAVGQDGSVILCTMSGSVWRKEKRANIKSVRTRGQGGTKPKDYKFVRVPNITRAIAVRSNAFGAFVAIRKDCDVTKEQITVDSPALWANLFSLLSIHKYGEIKDDMANPNPPVRFWVPMTKGPDPAHLKAAIITASDAETEVQRICAAYEPLADSQYDLWITSNVIDVHFPVHGFLLKARSRVMRSALTEVQKSYYFTIPDVLSVEYGKDGQMQLTLQGADFLTVANLVVYLYTDEVVDVWHHTSKALASAPRYRAVRTELMKIAAALELRQLERAARLMIDPPRSLASDMETAILDTDFFSDADVIVDLADDEELPAHSVMLTVRCPFFEGLFQGRAGGRWMSARRGLAEEKAEAIHVDLKHVDKRAFELVLRHLYADTGTELFDDIVTDDFDEFAELLLEVLSTANELMVDRLSEICQSILGRCVNAKNVCRLLNAVSECQVTEFKNAALEYICLNLEGMLEQRLLEELDPDILTELDEVVQQNQLAYLPFARSSRAHDELLEQHPELVEQIEEGRQRRIDSMRLRSRLADAQQREESLNKFKVGSIEKYGSSPALRRKQSLPDSDEPTPEPSPALSAREASDDLPFDMDEDRALGSPSLSEGQNTPTQVAAAQARDLDLAGSLGRSLEVADTRDRRASATPRSPDLMATSPGNALDRVSDSQRVPWQTPSPTAQRINLKDIMSQASTSRVSNLSESLAKAREQKTKPQKTSQKERKKQQQQQAKQQEEETPKISHPESGKPTSPWQTVCKPSGGIETVGSRQSAPVRPAMTMRQTVSGGSPSVAVPGGIEHSSQLTSEPLLLTTSKPSQPVVQSIRHTPVRSSMTSGIDARTSMADILAQQQGEKVAIKEAVAKRSLQEIQQEQEFQEWWDNETKRVQEEAQASAAPGRRGKGGRGRTGRRGSARVGANTKDTSQTGHDSKVPPSNETKRTSQQGASIGRGAHDGQRGRGRSRGRGQ
jgi:inhibitor of Bruton tyrosine kinase